MRRWYEGAEEGAFRPVQGGYVVRLPSGGLIGRSQHYFVNEAQKAEIATVLRYQRLLMLLSLLFLLPIGGAFGLLIGIWRNRDPGLSPLWIEIGIPLLVVCVFATFFSLNFYVMRSLRPLLAVLPRSELRIGFHEQVQRIAKAVSGKILAIGIVGGSVMAVSNMYIIGEAILGGRAEMTLVWNSIACLGGGLLTAYFAWLIALRLQPNGNAA
jgi:hypothetical protein